MQLPHQPVSTHRFTCDADGWVFRANSESPYPHFFHVLSPSDIQAVTITGDVEISFVGFGDSECRKSRHFHIISYHFISYYFISYHILRFILPGPSKCHQNFSQK